MDEVTQNQEIVIVRRRGSEDVALVSAAELSSLMETAHLFISPKNAERLLTALNRAKSQTIKPQTIEECARRLNLSKKSRNHPAKRIERAAVFQPGFREDLRYWVKTGRKIALRAFDLIEAICETPLKVLVNQNR